MSELERVRDLLMDTLNQNEDMERRLRDSRALLESCLQAV